jgi:hypothetical protein
VNIANFTAGWVPVDGFTSSSQGPIDQLAAMKVVPIADPSGYGYETYGAGNVPFANAHPTWNSGASEWEWNGGGTSFQITQMYVTNLASFTTGWVPIENGNNLSSPVSQLAALGLVPIADPSGYGYVTYGSGNAPFANAHPTWNSLLSEWEWNGGGSSFAIVQMYATKLSNFSVGWVPVDATYSSAGPVSELLKLGLAPVADPSGYGYITYGSGYAPFANAHPTWNSLSSEWEWNAGGSSFFILQMYAKPVKLFNNMPY